MNELFSQAKNRFSFENSFNREQTDISQKLKRNCSKFYQFHTFDDSFIDKKPNRDSTATGNCLEALKLVVDQTLK
jgi:hypothetical protein